MSLSANTSARSSTSNKSNSNNRETNIQVVVRCRPQNSREIHEKESCMVECFPARRELCVTQIQGSKDSTKTFTFDKVFGPDTRQADLYAEVVAPIVEEVLMGYNCTIFAYGQTGTGKTHTMEGSRIEEFTSIPENPEAGVIPRTLQHLFDILDAQDNEFTVRISQVELFNEELRDLLSADDDVRKLKIFEDSQHKGCVIQGVEEILVNNAAEVIQIMQRGSNKRKNAPTKLNPNSSRSHCVFSITVHIKEPTPDGEDLLKIGKLNLVDLAGSENIARSGAENKHAREAGLINQSLLTLGRVINALIDHCPHIPYRESKLTRLLQDSLGGRTKTCIIATISPSRSCLDESLSTLDYAYRAKSIRNRPEINQRMTKKALITQYAVEIERLKSDLAATQSKNGVFLAPENYQALNEQLRIQKQTIEESIRDIEIKAEQLTQVQQRFSLTREELDQTKKTLNATTSQLNESKAKLVSLESELSQVRQSLLQQSMLTSEHVKTEQQLNKVASELLGTVENTLNDITGLHQKIDRKNTVENHNRRLMDQVREGVLHHTADLHARTQAFQQTQTHQLQAMMDALQVFAREKQQNISSACLQLEQIQHQLTHQYDQMSQSASTFVTTTSASANNAQEIMKSHTDDVSTITTALTADVTASLTTLRTNLDLLRQQMNAFTTNMSDCTAKMIVATHQHAAHHVTDLQALRQTVSNHVELHQHRLMEQQNLALQWQQRQAAARERYRSSILSTMESLLNEYDQAQDTIAAEQVQAFQASADLTRTSNIKYASDIEHHVAAVETHMTACQQSVTIATDQLQHMATDAMTAVDSVGVISVNSINSVEGVLGRTDTAVQLAQRKWNTLHTTALQQLVGETSKHVEEQSALSLASTATVIGGQATVAKALNTTATEIAGFAQDTTSQMAQVNENARMFENELSSCLTEFRDTTQEHITRKVQTDLETGKTPTKRTYHYPKSWSLTRPHDVILKEITPLDWSQ